MSQVTVNEKRIRSAFARMAGREQYAARMAAEESLKEAVQYAMDIHEADEGNHKQHLVLDNHYGWILLHNGELVSTSLYKGTIPGGTVGKFLEAASLDLPADGWEGIVVAGMDIPNLPSYIWDIGFEIDVIKTIADDARANFPIHIVKFLKRAK